APTQREQIEYVRSRRVLKTGWKPAQLQQYFARLQKAQGYKGGHSVRGFLRHMIDDALATLNDEEKTDILKALLQTPPSGPANPVTSKPRPTVKNYKLDDLAPRV